MLNKSLIPAGALLIGTLAALPAFAADNTTSPTPPAPAVSAPAAHPVSPGLGGASTGVGAGGVGLGSGAGTSAAAQPKPEPDPLAQADVSRITGSAVYGSDDKKIGSVSTILQDPGSKTIKQFVVNTGVMGMGGRDIALGVDQFKWDQTKDGFRISQTDDQLKSMPEWKKDTQ